MIHALDYDIVLSEQGIPVFVLPYSRQTPEKPVLLYDGGEHATLFRNDHDVLLLDFLPDEIRPILQKCGWMVVAEKTKTDAKVARDYKVRIKNIKANPLVDK